jgi:hypothetical protein
MDLHAYNHAEAAAHQITKPKFFDVLEKIQGELQYPLPFPDRFLIVVGRGFTSH